MLQERNQAVIGVIVALLLAAGTAFAVGATTGMFAPGERIEAEFTDAAGLGAGDFVYVSGVRSGQVLDVVIDGDVARATFTLTAPEIPADSTADIIIRNTLGKRAIRIQPGSSDEILAEGSLIPVERTSTPIDLPELGDRSAELLGEVDVDAMQALTTALADITEGNREDVIALLDGVERVTRIVSERREDLAQIIQRSEVLIDAAADKDQQLVTIIERFGSTLDVLARSRNEVTTLLAQTAAATDTAATLLEDREAQIDRIINELTADLAIVDAHQVDLSHALAYLGVGVEGFASIGYSGGQAKLDNPSWGNVFTTGLGEAGIDAIFGCGGTMDDLFTELIGPDPRCTQGRPGNPPSEPEDESQEPEAADSSSAGVTEQEPTNGLDAFFRLAPAGGDPR